MRYLIVATMAIVFSGCAMMNDMLGIQGVREMNIEGRQYKCVDDPNDETLELCTYTRPNGDSVTIERKKI